MFFMGTSIALSWLLWSGAWRLLPWTALEAFAG
jgi:hypothetical protein